MTREELLAIIRKHGVNGTWCYGCKTRVPGRGEHLAEMIMPPGVDYLLEGRWLDGEEEGTQPVAQG